MLTVFILGLSTGYILGALCMAWYHQIPCDSGFASAEEELDAIDHAELELRKRRNAILVELDREARNAVAKDSRDVA
jgi:hypothetical protein